ncbi:hypothetical protein IJG21_00545 [Candidatus Saccharibacteria bacterium]|nr:hypothetical protein [Candidatus Saccharibacteria bacterium]
MKKILGIIIGVLVMVGAVVPGVCFADYNTDYCNKLSSDELKKANGCDLGNNYQNIIGGKVSGPINVILWIVGVLSVVMIIYGGLSYMTSAGDAAKVNKAKTILIYSIVGLIIAILAYAIVNFVIGKVA